MHKRIIFLGFLILLVAPLILAGNYGAGTYGLGLYGIGEIISAVTESVSGVVGGGGSSTSPPQFDIKILQIESPLTLGESFDFTYFVKGVGKINNDVTINFWIENLESGKVMTSGSDVIFMGNNEEKTEAANLFLPTQIESGIYQFNINVSFGSISAESHRTIEIVVEGNIAKINQFFDIGFSLENILIESSEGLVSIINIENFLEEPITIYLNFIILDKNGKEVHRETEIIIVETEEISKKFFKNLNLKKGRYTLILETSYDSKIFDEFRQDFEIRKLYLFPSFNKNLVNYIIGILATLSIIIVLVIIILKKLKERRIERLLDSNTPKDKDSDSSDILKKSGAFDT